MKSVEIFGAGLSGLIAAINLARDGYQVTLHEKESKIGGSPKSQPSIHMTPVDLKKMQDYIGIDVEPCFSELDEFRGYIYSEIATFNNKHLYVVERGSRKTSIETYLYNIALEEGVNFEFSHPLSSEILDTLPDYSIIATGGYSKAAKYLNLKHVVCKHFDSHIKIDSDKNICLAYFSDYSEGYGYVATKNGIRSGQISFALDTPNSNLDHFKDQLKETENIEFGDWHLVTDYWSRRTQLFKRYSKKTFILAGAVSGFMEPFFSFGVNGAMVSGKIAAMAITSRKKALQEFRRFTADLNRLFLIDRFYFHLPLKKLIIPRIFSLHKDRLPIVGKSMKSIPGFTHEDCFQIVNIRER